MSLQHAPTQNPGILARSPPVRVEGDQVLIRRLAERRVALVKLHRPAGKQKSELATDIFGVKTQTQS